LAKQSTNEKGSSSQRAGLGRFAERLAVAHLESLGYVLVARNAQLRIGEIDVVALKDGQTVLVEVRARRGAEADDALFSLTVGKQRRMRLAAERFLALHPELPQEARIDFVAVALSPGGKVLRIDVVENAVEG
jgi:putative endonuclease